MDTAGSRALRDAIKQIHGVDSKWVESVTVQGKPVGEVQVFFLISHPKATRAYAWSLEAADGSRRFVAVLETGPVKDAATAVAASLTTS